MKTAVVILAAGEGTRMKSSIPKVLHPVCGVPMLLNVINAASGLKPEKTIVVAGRHIDRIRQETEASEAVCVRQEQPKGTADAVRSAESALKGFRGIVLVMNGDTPLVRTSTLRSFVSRHKKSKCGISVLSFPADDPTGYGRIVRDGAGKFMSIVEEKDADSDVRNICEVNSGVYAINHDLLSLLRHIGINRKKGEYYLTDIIPVALDRGITASAVMIGEETEFMGVNTRTELLRASELMRMAVISGLIDKGVNLVDPASVFISPSAAVGRDSTLYPNVFIEGNSRIGNGTVIYPHARISRSRIGSNAVIKDSTVIEDSVVKSGASVGPFAHIRPGSVIGENSKVGNFVELKKALFGKGVKASHLSYIGDAVVGNDVNIGAGTITCNYDGRNKHRTVIGDDVFVGSDTQLVAPVKVGKGAYIGAGSTITQDVPERALAVSRTRQRNIEGWAGRRRK